MFQAAPWENDPIIGPQRQTSARPPMLGQAPGSPLVGPPRMPPPQTGPQAAIDAGRAGAAPYDEPTARANAARAAAEAQRAAIQLQIDQRNAAAGPAAASNESTLQAAGFYERALNANRQYGSGVPPRGVIAQTAADYAPQYVVNSLTGDTRQHAEAAAREFVAATLRRESGAAISPAEYASQYSRYFPQPGDTPQTIAQKAQLRATALDALRLQAGAMAGPATASVDQMTPDAAQQHESPPTFTGTNAPPANMPPGNRGPERMDTTNRAVMSRGPDTLNVGGAPEYVQQADPALAGINERVAGMIGHGRSRDEILQYILSTSPNFPQQELAQKLDRLIAWRSAHPNYHGPYDVQLDQRMVPQTATRRIVNALADSAPGAAALAAGDTVLGGHLDNLVEATGGNPEMVNAAEDQMRQRHPIGSVVGDIAGGASLYGAGRAVAGRVLGRALPLATRTLSAPAIAGDAALGGYVGSGQGGTQMVSPSGALGGAATGALGGVAGRGVINTAGRAVAPTGGALAPLYAQGVEPSIGQRMGGVVNRAEQGLASIPFVGGIQRGARDAALQQMQRGAFNQALSDIGEQLPRGVTDGTPAHAYMQRAFNREFSDIRSRMRFVPDQQFATDFGALQQDIALLPEASQSVFNQIVRNNVGMRLRARGGALTGGDYVQATSRIDAKVRAIRNNPNGDHELADVLERLSDSLDDAASRQSGPDLAARLTSARRGYQKAVIIEDAARRRGGEAGTFSPASLNAAVQKVSGGVRSRQFLRGEAPLQDYAQSAQHLGQTLADSGTPERMMTMGSGVAAVGATGAAPLLGHPVFAAPWALNTAMNLPGLRRGVNWALRPDRTIRIGGRKIPVNSPEGRRLIQSMAPGASLLGPGMIPMLPGNN